MSPLITSPRCIRTVERAAGLAFLCLALTAVGCDDASDDNGPINLQPDIRDEGGPQVPPVANNPNPDNEQPPVEEPVPEADEETDPAPVTPSENDEESEPEPEEPVDTEEPVDEQPVPGTVPEGDEQPLGRDLNCFELIECLRPCGADEACGLICRDQSSEEAVILLEDLLTCLRASGCPQDDGDCQFEACGDEYDICVEQRNGEAPAPAEPEPQPEPEPEPEPEAAVEVIGQGEICCGDAGAICDLDVEVCCSTWIGKECRAECNANLELTQTCDGAEDCADGQICCALADALVPASFGSTCRDACEAGEQILDAGLACEVGEGEVIEPEPEPEPIQPGDADDEDETDGPAGPDNRPPAMDGDCGLTLRAEARDESGPCVACTQGDYITAYAVIENPCEVPLSYRSERSCLASEFTVRNMQFDTSAIYPATCRVVGRFEALAPGESVTQSRPAGRLSPSRYELVVQFEDADRTERVTTFTVE